MAQKQRFASSRKIAAARLLACRVPATATVAVNCWARSGEFQLRRALYSSRLRVTASNSSRCRPARRTGSARWSGDSCAALTACRCTASSSEDALRSEVVLDFADGGQHRLPVGATVWSYAATACAFAASRAPPSNNESASAGPTDQKRLGSDNKSDRLAPR